MRRFALRLGVLSLVLSATAVTAAEPRLATEIEPRRLTVGDRAELVVSLDLPAEVPADAVTWPSWNDRFGPAEVLAIGPVESAIEGGERRLRQRIVLTLFETGSFTLPSVAVTLATGAGPRTMTAQALGVEVVSVLPAGEMPPEPKPPAPPRPLPLDARFWWLVAALLAACLGALGWLIAASARRRPQAEEPVLAPLAELERALADLDGESDTVTVHAGVSLALRRYLGRALAFTAPESTTTEVDRALRRRRLETGLVRRTVELLTACDMVKFARREATGEETRRRLEEAARLGEDVERWLRPETSDGAAGEPPLAEAS